MGGRGRDPRVLPAETAGGQVPPEPRRTGAAARLAGPKRRGPWLPGAVWTRPRAGKVIQREFGVTYTPQQVGNILRKLGWSPQKPMARASQRDEAALAAWRSETRPVAVTTRAPRGQTPVLMYPFWQHLLTINAVTPAGKPYTWVQDQTFKGSHIVRFLQHLLHHIPGKLLVAWDGLAAHRGQAVKRFLSAGAAQRLHLEQLPGYAPDLNPNEGVWRHLKRVELANLCCHDLDELRGELRKAIARLQYRSSLIQSFFRQAQLDTDV